MINDDRHRYRWQDHVITPDHARVNVVASALVIAIICSALVSGLGNANTASSVTAHTLMDTNFSLAHIAERPAYPLRTESGS